MSEEPPDLQHRDRVVLHGIEAVTVAIFALVERLEDRPCEPWEGVGVRHGNWPPESASGVEHQRVELVRCGIRVRVAQRTSKETRGNGDHGTIHRCCEAHTGLALVALEQLHDVIACDRGANDGVN